MGLTLLLQGLVTLLVVTLVVAGYHRWILRPELTRRDQAAKEAWERALTRLEMALDERFEQLQEDKSANSLAGTTRQFMRFGSELMEGGLSAFLSDGNFPSESSSHKHHRGGNGR